MTTPILHEFPYRRDSARLFDALATRPWAVFLDSGFPLCEQGRYDILAADPEITLTTRGQETEICGSAGRRLSPADPFQLLQEALGPAIQGIEGIPFCGGAVGYFGYDLGRRLERLPSIAIDTDALPEMAVAIYSQALVVDHRKQCSWLVGQDSKRVQRFRAQLQGGLSSNESPPPAKPFRALGDICSNLTHSEYLAAISRIDHYIHEGDCYQVNLAQRFSVRTEGDPWQGYMRLRRLNSAPYSAYLNTPDCQIMSSSPERFLRVRKGAVETRPIKGTSPRADDPVADRALAEALLNSPKERAENLMIVDLLRNDLGKVCTPGSIQVPALFQLESFARVHHLVSTIRGQLAQDQTALSLLRACFPGGSITGAPKLRAMEIIEELEPQRRGVYCGSIGYIGFDGAMDSNIAIRTLVHAEGITRLWAGGGITADSDAEAEYRETYHKAAALLDMLQPKDPGNARDCTGR